MRYSPNLISFLRRRLADPLPGVKAHMRLAPSIRRAEVMAPADARQSAVLILLYPHQDHWYIPFMRRTDDGRVHGGQISFPGGGRDPEDLDFTDTALREAEEEMGIPPAEVEVLGSLTDLYIPPSNSLVHPRIGVMGQQPNFVPDPLEVAEVIEVELAQFFLHPVPSWHQVKVRDHLPPIEAPGFMVNERELIWGATAMIMAEVLWLVEEAKQFMYNS